MRKRILATHFTALLGGATLWHGPTARADESEFRIIVSQKIDADLAVGSATHKAPGDLQLVLKGDKQSLAEGRLEVVDLGVALHGVRQALLSNRTPQGKATGVVAFRGLSGAQIRYDQATHEISGRLSGFAHFPQLAEIIPYKTDPREDGYEATEQSAALAFKIRLDKPIPTQAVNQIVELSAGIGLDLKVAGLSAHQVNGYGVKTQAVGPAKMYWIVFPFEIARELCVQPVSVKSSAGDLSPTGAGLAFGTFEANNEWRKGDVVFKFRSFKTIVSATLKTLSESEAGSLLGKVEDDDCIEVFFVASLSPVSLWGGGATFALGSASAQVITSDGMVPAGIDKHHLAHELGHVVNLKHPGGGTPAHPAGSSGTLMCPSGWLNDNPDKNSLANRDHASNPLFKLVIRAKGPAPDCTNDATCGPC